MATPYLISELQIANRKGQIEKQRAEDREFVAIPSPLGSYLNS